MQVAIIISTDAHYENIDQTSLEEIFSICFQCYTINNFLLLTFSAQIMSYFKMASCCLLSASV